MVTINTSSLAAYSSVYTGGIKTAADSKVDESKSGEASTVSAELRGNVLKTDGEDTKAGAAGASNPIQEAIERLQKEIKETRKLLLREQQQLAAAQNSKAPEQEKASRIMAIQQQIAGTQAQLMSQQAALMTLIKGTVSTTA